MTISAGAAEFRAKRLALFTALLWVACAASAAIDPDLEPSQVVHRHYGRAAGLPAEVVWSVIQDRNGYLWAGTQNGLVQYDGVRFRVFDGDRDPAFKVNDIRVVAEGPDGRIWAGSYGGGVVVGDDSGFTAITRADGLAGDIVYDIHFAADGAAWFATASGVSRLVDGEFTNWTTADGLAADRVFKIEQDRDGKLWFATLTGGVSAFDGQRFFNFSTGDGLDSAQIHLLDRVDDALLIGSYGGGLFRAEGLALAPMDRGELPADVSITSALADRHGQLWLGSYGGGLWRRLPAGRFERFTFPVDDPSHVFDLLPGREGELWLAAVNGLHRLSASPFIPWGAPEGLADFTFVVLADPASGAVWSGVENGGLYRVDRSGRIEHFGSESGLQHPSVSALTIDREGTLWVGTFGGGVHRFEQDRLIPATWSEALPGRQIYALLAHSDGALWVATEGGVARVRGEQMQVLTAADGLPGNLVRHFMEDRHGAVWMATPQGLAIHAEGTVRPLDPALGLSGKVVTTTFEDADGAIWIGTRSNGLARLADGRLFRFTAEHGLAQDSVFAIVPDASGHLWLSGAAGLVRVDREALVAVAEGRAEQVDVRLFDEADGLRSSRFMVGFQPAGTRTADGRIWLPTNRGLIAFDPAAIEPPRLDGEVLIERVLVDSAPISVTPDAAAPILLPADSQSLEIEYTVPRLLDPQRLEFRYRLGDADTPWQNVSERRTAYFTNLPPGQQRFEVQARLAGSAADSTPVATLSLLRQPFWFETLWARALGFLTVAALVALLVRALVQREQRRRLHLEQLVDRRTAELRQALATVEAQSRIDGLTGVANRRYFEERLAAILDEAARERRSVSLLMIDIDRFKEYNDLHGHLAGDECLRQVAAAMQRSLTRDGDLLARYGGEEFALVLRDTDGPQAERVAERIRAHVEALELDLDDRPEHGRITVSIGLSSRVPNPADSSDELIDEADRALYQAKRAGRNRCVVAGPALG